MRGRKDERKKKRNERKKKYGRMREKKRIRKRTGDKEGSKSLREDEIMEINEKKE